MAKQKVIVKDVINGSNETYKSSALTTLKLPSDLKYDGLTKSKNNLIIEFYDWDAYKSTTITIKDYFKNPKKSKFKYIIDSDGKNIENFEKGVYTALAKNKASLDFTFWGEEKGINFKGTKFSDLICGTQYNDKIKAGNGNNEVYGGDGDDIIYGGNGNNEVYGGDGDDIIYGGNGNDKLYGDNVGAYGVTDTPSGGNDKIYTGKGNDYIEGQEGDDKIYITGKGIKTIYKGLGDGNDIVYGAKKATRVDVDMRVFYNLEYTKQGNDLIVTGVYTNWDDEDEKEYITIKDAFKASKKVNIIEDIDYNISTSVKQIFATKDIDIKYSNINKKQTIKGTNKNNVITGGNKNDTIYTGAGVDTVIGSKGNDTIKINGSGTKTIDIANSDGNDTISGFGTTGAKTVLNFTEIKTDSVGDVLANLKFKSKNNNLVITREYQDSSKSLKGNVYLKNGVLTTSSKNSELVSVGDKLYKYQGKYYTEEGFGRLNLSESVADKIITVENFYKVGKTITTELSNTTTLKDYFKTVNTSDVSFASSGDKTDLVEVLKNSNVLFEINKSKATKKQTIHDTVVNDNIIGSKYNDFIYTSGGNDILNGGKGSDTYYVNTSDMDKYNITIKDSGNNAKDIDTISFNNDVQMIFDLVKGDDGFTRGDNIYFVSSAGKISSLDGSTLSISNGVQAKGVEQYMIGETTYNLDETTLDTIASNVAGWLGGTDYNSVAEVFTSEKTPGDIGTLLVMYNPQNS